MQVVINREARRWEEAGVPSTAAGCLTLGASRLPAPAACGGRAGEHVFFHSTILLWPACGREQEHGVQIRLHLSHGADVCPNIPLDCIITEPAAACSAAGWQLLSAAFDEIFVLLFVTVSHALGSALQICPFSTCS